MTTTTPATERVGRYQLLEPIGIGPSGTVSRAKVFGVAGFERQFAVKRFHAELTATAAMAAMLSAAARAYGSLEHPRIARMSEFGVAQGATFTAVEYVVGLDALRLVSEAKLAGVTLAAGGALALVSQAARAVGYAHGRGLTHLGLAPTNVIVTGDGDIKITDFGILSATLPPRPVDVSRLAQRIPYLAPEQLANEATSAATDVFALGVLAYELVTGSRAFKGGTPQAVAAAIMAGPPAEPPLPRPIVRVLQRCLARSPFERFPDARAMADALDAALRVAPVPGTRKDIGAQVKETLDRLAALNEGQMSGMVALHLGTGPIRTLTDDDLQRAAAAAPQPAAPSGPLRTPNSGPLKAGSGPTRAPGSGPFVAQVPPLPGPPTSPPTNPPTSPSTNPPTSPPSSLMSPSTTLPDLPRQPVTVPGLAPPPIPVPPGVAMPPSAPLSGPPGNNTLLGLGKAPPAIPSIRPRPAAGTARPLAIPSITGRAPTRPGDPIAIEPAGPQAQRSLALDASIHALESDDLELDSPLADALDLDAIDDVEPVEAQRTEPVTIDPSNRATTVDNRAETVDPATRAETVDPGRVVDPESDPSSRPTRDLNVRAAEPEPGASVSQIALVTEGVDDLLNDAPDNVLNDIRNDRRNDGSEAAAEPALGRTDTRPDPQLGRTMLGIAAPTPSSGTRRLAPPDKPIDHRADDGIAPPGDELAAMALEGFHTADDAPPATRGPGAPSHTPAPPPAPSQPIPRTPPPMPPGWVSAPVSNPALSLPPHEPPAPSRSRGVVLGLVGLAILGVGGWQLYTRVIAPPSSHLPETHPVAQAPGDAKPGPSTTPAIAPPSAPADAKLSPTDAKLATAPTDAKAADAPPADAKAGPADAAPADAKAGPADAAPVDAKLAPVDAKLAPDARLAVDAGAPDAKPTVDAGTTAPTSPKPPIPAAPANATAATSLAIASTPPGAHIFLDGADAGATPAKLAGSPDRHNLALVLPGHELYLAQVDGHGTFQVPLKEVTPTNGPAGIKVLRCKDKNRYYVFVDGKPTGQTCPTERIGCEVGAHTVEVYDAVTETRHKWDIVVKDTRLSFRVRVE